MCEKELELHFTADIYTFQVGKSRENLNEEKMVESLYYLNLYNKDAVKDAGPPFLYSILLNLYSRKRKESTQQYNPLALTSVALARSATVI